MAENRNARLITKRTSVPGKIPSGTTGNETNLIQSGELASNLADKKLWGYNGTNIFEYGSNSFLGLTGGTITGNTSFIGNLSASTLFSGSTDVETIIRDLIASDLHTFVQPGSNITTGGTFGFPVISVVDSPSFNELTLSGDGYFLSTISGMTGADFNLSSTDIIFIDGSTNLRGITVGAIRQTHIPSLAGTRAYDFQIDTNGFGDTKAIEVNYTLTAFSTDLFATALNFNVDPANSTGGHLDVVRVNSINDENLIVDGLHVGANINPIRQDSGGFIGVTTAYTTNSIFTVFTDVTNDFNSTLSDTSMFDNDDDYVVIGGAKQFPEISFVFDTVASGAGVKPIFEYSTGGIGWAAFSPIDSTNGFRQNGNISWGDEISGWSTDTVNGVSGLFWIRIRRTQNTLTTSPIEDLVQVSTSTQYLWDKYGNLKVNNVFADTFSGNTTDAVYYGIGSGITGMAHSGLTEIGNRTHPELDGFWKFSIGSIIETTEVNITSSGGTVSLSLEKFGGGDLTLNFSGGSFNYNSTPAASITLTTGSDISPQINYIYIDGVTKLLTASTVSFPSIQHAPIATAIIQSASGVDSNGLYKLHVWTDHLSLEGDNGHLSHVNSWIRAQHATWISGVSLTPTITTNGGSLDNFNIATTFGFVRQLHPHSFPIRDTSITGSTGHVLVINDPTIPYVKYDDLNLIIQDSDGTTLRNNDDRYNLVVWGIVNETDSSSHIIINLPNGKYSGGGGKKDDAAIFDDEKTANYLIPNDYIGVGFLIARLTVKYKTSGGGTLEILQTEDIRGQLPTIVAGGTTHQITDFADNVFKIFDQNDSTKQIAFEVSGITTSTVRTYTAPDVNGTLITTGNLNDIVFSGISSTAHTHTISEVQNLQNNLNTKADISGATFNSISATTISGGTIYGDGSNLTGLPDPTLYWTAGTGTNSVKTKNSGNIASGYNSLAGGLSSTASGNYSSLSFGYHNTASGANSASIGGGYNVTSNYHTFIGGGYQNTASGYYSAIIGGQDNIASNYRSTILGGIDNLASGPKSSIIGGSSNSATTTSSVVIGGEINLVSGIHSSIIAGFSNLSYGVRSVIIGGQNITGSTDDTVYVPNFNINSTPSETTSATTYDDIVRDSNGDILINNLFFIGVNFETTGTTWNYVAPEVFQVDSIDESATGMTYSLLHNGTGYTFGNSIALYDDLSITGVTAVGLLKLNSKLI